MRANISSRILRFLSAAVYALHQLLSASHRSRWCLPGTTDTSVRTQQHVRLNSGSGLCTWSLTGHTERAPVSKAENPGGTNLLGNRTKTRLLRLGRFNENSESRAPLDAGGLDHHHRSGWLQPRGVCCAHSQNSTEFLTAERVPLRWAVTEPWARQSTPWPSTRLN